MSLQKPNIVVITADQWRGDCIGALKGRHPVMTPHINQLAAEGYMFSNAFADCPICMPQRATFLNGLVGSHHGQTNHFSCRTPVDPQTSLPALLSRQAGYQTKAIGKVHFSPARARLGFEHIRLHPDDYVNYLEDAGYGGMYRGHGLGGNEVYPAVSAIPERFTHTHWIVDESIKFLSERDPECPFFLWMVFEAPHSPYDPPEPYDRMYDNFTIPEPVCGDWLDDCCPPDLSVKAAACKFDELNAEIIRETRRRYYGQISHIDYQLGRFLGELQRKGLYGDTVIVFTSDHGDHIGDHGLFGKCTFLKGSADVPLILRLPSRVGLPEKRFIESTPVLTADLFPTLLEVTDIEYEYDGVSLLSTLRGEQEGRIVCGEFGNGDGTAFAADGRMKYIYYADGGVEQLFDMKNDPDDLRNLAGTDDYSENKAFLKNALIRYLEKYKRPMTENGGLITLSKNRDKAAERRRNPYAWRGPLRYGQGYSN